MYKSFPEQPRGQVKYTRILYEAVQANSPISLKGDCYASTWIFSSAGTLWPNRINSLVPGIGAGRIWWGDGCRPLSSLGTTAGAKPAGLALDGRARYGDTEGNLRARGDLRIVPLPPCHYRAISSYPGRHVPPSFLAGHRHGRRAQRACRRR